MNQAKWRLALSIISFVSYSVYGEMGQAKEKKRRLLLLEINIIYFERV